MSQAAAVGGNPTLITAQASTDREKLTDQSLPTTRISQKVNQKSPIVDLGTTTVNTATSIVF